MIMHVGPNWYDNKCVEYGKHRAEDWDYPSTVETIKDKLKKETETQSIDIAAGGDWAGIPTPSSNSW